MLRVVILGHTHCVQTAYLIIVCPIGSVAEGNTILFVLVLASCLFFFFCFILQGKN